MARRRSQHRPQRLSEPGPGDTERIEISSDEEALPTQEALVRDGTSSIPDGGFSALPEEQQDELVKRMIRLMVCRNAMKKPVKREDLSKHVFANMANIKSKTKVFHGTLAAAQQKLRTIFGMEMVLIQRQLKQNRTQSSRTQMSATQSGASGTKGYILVSVLAPGLRAEDRKGRADLGFLMVVAGMILLEPGCRIEQGTLYRALTRLGVHVREKQGHKQLNGGNVKELLESLLVKQWYLEREKEGQTFYYTLGPRFRAEIDQNDLIEFVGAVYDLGGQKKGGLDDTSKAELKKRIDEACGVSTENMDEEEE